MLGASVRPVISCDGVPDYATADDARKYREYLRRLERLDVAELRVASTWIGHASTLAACIDESTKEIVLATEDDEIIRRPETIDSCGIVNALREDNPVQCVRLVRRNPFERRTGNYKVIADLGKLYGVPLLANRGWATSTHLATRSFYERRVLPNLKPSVSVKGDGRGGTENEVWVAYRTRCKSIGEMEAWREWGVSLYWDGRVTLDHAGRERSKWRMSRRLALDKP